MRVQFQTAVLLREAGFDRETGAYFDLVLDENPLSYGYDPANWNSVGEDISAPTLYEVFDWLREVHSLHIHMMTTTQGQWLSGVTKLEKGQGFMGMMYDHKDAANASDTFEEALETGIIHALNQIK